MHQCRENSHPDLSQYLNVGFPKVGKQIPTSMQCSLRLQFHSEAVSKICGHIIIKPLIYYSCIKMKQQWMQNFQLVKCYYNNQIDICTVIVDLYLKNIKIQWQLHTILNQNVWFYCNSCFYCCCLWHCSFSVFIIFRIISIMMKDLSEKFSVLIMILIRKSCLRESRLCENAAIKWHHMMNRETILIQNCDLVMKTSCNWTKALLIILNVTGL